MNAGQAVVQRWCPSALLLIRNAKSNSPSSLFKPTPPPPLIICPSTATRARLHGDSQRAVLRWKQKSREAQRAVSPNRDGREWTSGREKKKGERSEQKSCVLWSLEEVRTPPFFSCSSILLYLSMEFMFTDTQWDKLHENQEESNQSQCVCVCAPPPSSAVLLHPLLMLHNQRRTAHAQKYRPPPPTHTHTHTEVRVETDGLEETRSFWSGSAAFTWVQTSLCNNRVVKLWKTLTCWRHPSSGHLGLVGSLSDGWHWGSGLSKLGLGLESKHTHQLAEGGKWKIHRTFAQHKWDKEAETPPRQRKHLEEIHIHVLQKYYNFKEHQVFVQISH